MAVSGHNRTVAEVSKCKTLSVEFNRKQLQGLADLFYVCAALRGQLRPSHRKGLRQINVDMLSIKC